MKETEKQMHENIQKLFENDLRLLKDGVPANGIWTVCKLADTDFHGAVRIIPTEFGSHDYALWVDVFETIYDPIYSNTLFKGNLAEIREWLKDETNIGEAYACMQRLHGLAAEE